MPQIKLWRSLENLWTFLPEKRQGQIYYFYLNMKLPYLDEIQTRKYRVVHEITKDTTHSSAPLRFIVNISYIYTVGLCQFFVNMRNIQSVLPFNVK